MGSSVVTNRHGTVHCLTIIGQIEGHMVLPGNTKTTKYEHVLPLLASVEESDEVDGLLLLLNTVGGDIEAGLGIAELVAGMTKPTATLVLGGGHSIGVPLAVCGKRTFIVPSASMTIHPVRMGGTVINAPATYRYFERMQERIVDFVARNSRISGEKFRELMLSVGDMANDVGSVIYGKEAVALGLIDRIGSLGDALDSLYRMMEEK
ncbi:MAG: ATP-dependent Clp protease proteolytic subunit [Oscillospiraceae bacterium]|nr:ATP-dependent Clp protease proteolytic subunit [Oscillospiraceae bacterium]MBQ6248632.1 ATP-dependent Clp protease proteolytic subunit [Oscillospiraceae bacterium]MBQ7465932.1 ATP-dependent Clp protease proteolytic subunit [Oscillospiraceae bacterium]MBR0211430.1 ATP-dependent Clp protease proteolytic subunit [Oscillospiraceae bacterium]